MEIRQKISFLQVDTQVTPNSFSSRLNLLLHSFKNHRKNELFVINELKSNMVIPNVLFSSLKSVRCLLNVNIIDENRYHKIEISHQEAIISDLFYLLLATKILMDSSDKKLIQSLFIQLSIDRSVHPND
ncbi:hypothetical protein BpHYR1_038353 [Brachionus plicatilis]|uniref:Uncharacterized protein n=1 Tax=Brachionus plicatilis TaxID=10195 RepID=A0A3M7RDY8_BRAPC|nr:hypothetical protein BpHYR1_038353 [Brachionus plicatilis]